MKIAVFNQRTDLVHVTTHNVLHNLVVGMGLVVAVLFVFLGDLTSAGIVALVIPLALLFSITVLYVQGKSANLLSIGAVDFGIIVDSSVIIVENIYRHITAPRRRPHAAADRPDRRRLARDRAAAVLLDDDHRLRVPPAVRDDRARRGRCSGRWPTPTPSRSSAPCCLAVTLAPVLCSFLFHNKKEEKDTLVDRVDEAALPPDRSNRVLRSPLR